MSFIPRKILWRPQQFRTFGPRLPVPERVKEGCNHRSAKRTTRLSFAVFGLRAKTSQARVTDGLVHALQNWRVGNRHTAATPEKKSQEKRAARERKYNGTWTLVGLVCILVGQSR